MKIVLFDMDGTLTEARKKIDIKMCAEIAKLQKNNMTVGIVTGSDIEYIKDQCSLFWKGSIVDLQKLLFFPCNGTKFYQYESKKSEATIYHQCDMKNDLGVQAFNKIVYKIFDSQQRIQYTLWGKELPLTGRFIDYRGSMINYCPIGRAANHQEREKWISLDKKHNIRNSMLKSIFKNPVFKDVTVKLGGDTSFDIYPHGWDKTYAMSHFEDYEIYFLGDRCGDNGNDKEIFDALQPECSFWVDGTQHTKEILEEILIPKLGE